MSVFLFIELERDIPGFQDRFYGKPLAYVQTRIDAIAKRLRVTPIGRMMSMSAEQAAELAEETQGFDADDFATVWYDAADGLRTFNTLLDYFAKHPDKLAAFEYPDHVREDLEQAARTLKAVQDAGVRFFIGCAY
jgi:hypothetical protein